MNNEEFSLEDLKEALFRKGKYGLLAFTITIILAVFYIVFKQPVYESETRVRLSGASSVTEMVLAGVTTPWNDIPTQLELIKSKIILKKVVDQLNLRFEPIDKKFYNYLRIDTLAISDSAPSGIYTIKLLDSGFVILDQKGAKILEGQYGVISSSNCMTLKVNPVSPKAYGKTLKFAIKPINITIKNLYRNIKVSQEGKSFVAVIKARAKDPVLAKEIAERVAQGYYEFTLEDARFQASSLRLFLEEQITKIEQELTDYEKDLAEIKNKLGTYNFIALENISESLKDIFAKLNDLEFEKTKTIIEKSQVEREISIIKDEIQGKGYFKEYAKIATSLETGGDPRILSLQNKLYELELKKASLLEKYNSENPEIRAIENQINEIKTSLSKTQQEVVEQSIPSTSDPVFQQLIQQLIKNQVELVTLSAKSAAIDSALRVFEGKISTLPENALMYSKIKRKIQALSGIYNLLLEKLEQTKIEEASKISDVRIVDYAMIPTAPVLPKKVQTIFISIILGSLLGLFLTLSLYYIDDSVKFSTEVETILGKPCVGKIPPFSNHDGGKYSTLIIHKNPLSPEAEAFKKLRFNVDILTKGFPKIIAVTSIIENEGKSTIAANLALAYSLAGYRTLVIDGDLRKPSLHKIFEVPNEHGFTELVTKSILKPYPSAQQNLFVLPAGENSLNVLKILDAFDLKKIRELLTENFDVVILDTPPVLPVAEVNTLADFAGHMLLVVRADYTPKRLLIEFASSLPENIQLVGFVLNFYKRAERHYYKYYKYYHHESKDENNSINKLLKKLRIFKEG
uniref:Polysaccharide biosynthesis tyrosine autokinase n=1 Tax=candidate division CPR3 bacterium TaxID=2268181 RepID=A0A7V3J9J6_UNCC3